MYRPQNTHQAYQRKLFEIAKLEKKPSLLLHACCGPCASSCLVQLFPYFDITVYFTNPNIFPKSEYDRRLEELKAFIPQFNHDYKTNVKLLVASDDPQEFLSFAFPLREQKEGKERCHLCYGYRLEKTMQYATQYHYDYCATTLTLSRLKNSDVINQIGMQLQTKYPNVEYLCSDFKKNQGIDLSIELTTIYHMYRQDYCGCPYSMPKK